MSGMTHTSYILDEDEEDMRTNVPRPICVTPSSIPQPYPHTHTHTNTHTYNNTPHSAISAQVNPVQYDVHKLQQHKKQMVRLYTPVYTVSYLFYALKDSRFFFRLHNLCHTHFSCPVH